ncbi:MAG: DnaD domain protein [Caldicoprobacterales bacterium]|jgi:DnaD/phage-associated family protein
MTLCKFSDSYKIFDVTPVENLFIQEFMLKAPGDFVKVYLYGLMQCYIHNSSANVMAAFAHALEMDVKTIENAFHYWARQGILNFEKDENGKVSIEYFNIKDVLYNKGLDSEKNLYKYKDFNQNLQAIFDTRLLTPQEFLRVYDWIEVLNLPMEVVLMMCQFYVSRMGQKVHINYLDKVANTWAQEGINTMQKAEDYIKTNDTYFKNTVTVLKYLGIHRSPSQAELELYKKWNNWGFNLSAILFACRETTKIQAPTFAYLDKVLENMYKRNVITPEDVKRHLERQDDIYSRIKELYFEMGYKDNVPTPVHLNMYKEWKDKLGLVHDVIILACKECVKKKKTTFEHLDNLLEEWADLKLFTAAEVQEYLAREKTMDYEIKAVLDRAGEAREITLTDRKLYKKWAETWNLPFEVILLAAEYSVLAKDKVTYMNKILSAWHAKGINTVKAGKEDRERHLAAREMLKNAQGPGKSEKGLNKELDFTKFPQHTYTEEDLENLFENLD